MSVLTITFVAFGLSMDAFAVSIANGANHRFNKIFISAALFGLFQALLPILGWSAGMRIQEYIVNTDHWIAFILLSFIGSKMIYDSIRPKDADSAGNFPNSMKCLLMLALATSIDAMAVGLSFSFLQLPILFPAIVIGVITFGMSLAGCRLGKKFGASLGNKFTFAGGLILCLIGTKILIEHIR